MRWRGQAGPEGRRIYQRVRGPSGGLPESARRESAQNAHETFRVAACARAVDGVCTVLCAVAALRRRLAGVGSRTAPVGPRKRALYPVSPPPAFQRPRSAARPPGRAGKTSRSLSEAHLPAQEAQARPHARVPRPDADASRPDRPQAPSRKGPQAAHGLVRRDARAAPPGPDAELMAGPRSDGGRSRRRRLSRSADFERVYRQGRSKANRFLVLYAFPREDGRRGRRRRPAPRPVRVAPRRRRGRPHAREAGAARGVLAGGRAAARGRRLRRRRAAGGEGPGRARGDRRDARRRSPSSSTASVARRASRGPRRPTLTGPPTPAPWPRSRDRDRGQPCPRGADPALPARDLARAAAPLQVPPDLLGLRGAGDRRLRHTARLRARGMAAAALQPVQSRRLRPGLRPDPVPPAPRSTHTPASDS